jgi:aerobic-type carbon monoxide dehydrogenase small subunit (CoxS/CutS family)
VPGGPRRSENELYVDYTTQRKWKYGFLESQWRQSPVHRRSEHAPAKDVTTIEGLDPHGNHPVQRAWRAHDVSQCGYCQPGQIMQTAALLAQHPHPSEEEIINGMAGNICRCGTYQRLVAAIRTAAQEG